MSAMCNSTALDNALGFVPDHGVLRVEAVVVLGGEVEELRRDAPPLQRREGGDALALHEAKVLRAVDHQGRRLPEVRPGARRELLVGRRLARRALSVGAEALV